MSAPNPRGRGGSSMRGLRGAASSSQNRGSSRGRGASAARGLLRGGRGAAPTPSNAQGLLQQMRNGTIPRGTSTGAAPGARGRGTTRATTTSTPRGGSRGHSSRSFSNLHNNDSPSNSRPSSPFVSTDTSSTGDVQHRYNVLKNLREEERREAIRAGFLADPDKKTTLDKAITPVGTCTEMCPPYERVERIVQMMVDRCERVPDPNGGRPAASEEIMVKRFRRSAAGDDEQVPSDIRTPKTLRMTLDYLVDKLIGGPERLAVVHKFVWDRTRAIRNDFSIQQVSKDGDVQIAVECFERIARFHIMALHQLSNPENLLEGENFDVYQEREQLNNTLLSLLYYYDDHRDQINFPNEAEFRAYHIILAFQSQHPDIEDRVQSWPLHLLADGRVQSALRLYQAAGNTLFDQGPLKPITPFTPAQNDSGHFWTIMASGAVPYLLACVTELYFNQARFGALEALWRSSKSAPSAQQAKFRDWTLQVITEYLGFDTEEQTVDFCASFGLNFSTDPQGVTYLDVAGHKETSLDQSSIPKGIVFSHTYVEDKRCSRTLMAVINNVRPADALRQGMVEESDGVSQQQEVEDDGQSLFIPETGAGKQSLGPNTFNPEAAAFEPSKPFDPGAATATSTIFGQSSNVPASSPFGTKSAAPTSSSSSFTKKFGENLQQSWSSMTSAPSQSTAGSSQKFGDADQPWGQFATNEAKPPLPNFMTMFGTSRPSTEENNIFGPNPTAQVKSAPTPSQGQNLGENVPTTTLTSVAFDSQKFGNSALKSWQPVSTSGPRFSQPAVTAAQQATAPLSGFNFAKPAASPDTVPSSTPQIPNAPAASIADQQGPLSFSFTPQPNTLPESKSASPSSSHAQSSAQKPSFSFFSQPTTKTAPPAPPAQLNQLPEPVLHQPQPFPTPSSADVSKPAAPLFNLTPKAAEPAQATSPPAQKPLSNIKPVSVSSVSESTPSSPKATSEPSAGISPDSDHNQRSSGQSKSTTPPHSPVQPQHARQSPQIGSQLIEHVARLSLAQPNGLIQEYLEFALPPLLERLVKEHRAEVRQLTLSRLKTSYLFRKYGAFWRSITWRNNLNKRASKRRQMFSQSLRMEAEKKKRHDAELQEILAAMEETERIKAEARERQKAEIKQFIDKKPERSQIAGSKRKGLGESLADSSPNLSANKNSSSHHKRSRTIGSMLPPPPPAPQLATSAPSPSHFHQSIFSSSKHLNRSSSTSNLRKSEIRKTQDETKTDYFKLVAQGIDPDTPLVPRTARQVEAKQRRDREEREAAIARAYNRRRVGPIAASTSNSRVSSPATGSPAAPPPAPSPAPSNTSSVYDLETDGLLKQLREAREAMADDTKWFKEQAERMGKEVDEEKVQSSANSGRSLLVPQNGNASASPAPGMSMSRVEQYIQRNGPRLLSYKPISGSDYIPVPMSKRSAQRYSIEEEVEEIGTNGTAKKRRKRGSVDRSYRPGPEEMDEEEDDMNMSPQKRSKKHIVSMARTKASQQPVQHLQSSNKFSQLQEFVYGNEDEGEEQRDRDLSADEEDETEGYGHYFQQNGTATDQFDDDLVGGEEEDYSDQYGDEYDEDDEELEDEEDGYDYVGQHQPSKVYYEDAPTPNTQATSRATSSGPGATVEDAIPLSDSD
ncbi:uncharacterized protein HMPREF1541_04580 [Cyphellophora europaea CBS 101466]|uniref:SAC3/GANP/THP3 conserved domain-containing protein n=1 Tax=Cyphellophora europaea (strain CBS 101466) TaxID=1220924 RepID=W2RX74_CYPE1|nr:uncharacterized protein HMPREF1541_04580 [Cyphellophora europaea CBS 101466]ETN40304.1 hypothetical protein HMPREF1541_04580 [Cyphellophora europaea CBS 101466]